MAALSPWLQLLIFVISAAVIWAAGIRLSDDTDVLAERLHLGTALGGVVLLAVATNLPEIAITVSAARSGHLDIAIGNLLGGIAVQTVVLVAIDRFGVREKLPLTFMAASLTLVLEAALVVAVLSVTIAASQLPSGLTVARLEPGAVLIVLVWLAGLALIGGPGQRLPWQEEGQPPDGQEPKRGHARKQAEKAATGRGRGTAKVAVTFGVAAALTLVAGVTIEQSGEAFFSGIGLKGVVFGATVLALATALPEISTGLVAARHGDYQLAMGDIFGGNAFLPALFLLATVISGSSVLAQTKAPDIYLTALAALLTVVYLVGLVFRPKREVLGLGWDSIAVLVLYALGILGLTVLA